MTVPNSRGLHHLLLISFIPAWYYPYQVRSINVNKCFLFISITVQSYFTYTSQCTYSTLHVQWTINWNPVFSRDLYPSHLTRSCWCSDNLPIVRNWYLSSHCPVCSAHIYTTLIYKNAKKQLFYLNNLNWLNARSWINIRLVLLCNNNYTFILYVLLNIPNQSKAGVCCICTGTKLCLKHW